jgi:hypothetical protein
MPLFYAILTGQRNAPRAYAQLDVAVEPEAGDTQVTFRVFVNGAPLPNAPPVNTVNGFAKSGNLFTGVPNLTHALAEANVGLAGAAPASGVLRQKVSGGANILLGVGPKEKAASTRVALAVSDIMDGTTLLIANVNTGADTAAEVIIGNISAGVHRKLDEEWLSPEAPHEHVRVCVSCLECCCARATRDTAGSAAGARC